MFDGFLTVNKKPDVSSHDEVLLARRLLSEASGKKIKVGHSGTLDMPATGVLVLGVGRATRLLQFITALPKKYTAELVLGKSTDTGDDTGKTIATKAMPKSIKGIELENLKQVAENFLGQISQIPPMFSAKKVKGKRLYQLASEGKTIERKPQEVEIYNLEISQLKKSENIFKLEVECSAGTYIRTLGYDIAKQVGGEGHIQKLCRLSVGSFQLQDAIALNPTDSDSAKSAIIPMAEGMADYPHHQLTDADSIQAIKNGISIEMEKAKAGVTCSVLDADGELIAICQVSDSQLIPKVVIPS